jgi:DNA polymerase III delta subunit
VKDWPPLLIISGSEGFLRRRFLQDVVKEALAADRVIDYIDAGRAGSLESLLSTGEMFASPTLVLVRNPEKVNLDVVKAHNGAGDNTYLLVFHIEGNPDGRTKFGKFVKSLDKQHRSFPSPPSWKADEIAVEFCVEEAKRRNKGMSMKTSQALVSVVGSDLGILFYEILKAATYAESQGSTEIDFAHVKGTFASLSQAEVFPVVRALGELNLERVLRNLKRVKDTSRTDPTMKVCRVVGASVLRWLAAITLHEQGYSDDEAASMMGQKSKWFYQTKILAPAQAWGQKNLMRLVHAIALSERALLSGQVDPWTGLETRIVRAFPSFG